MATTAEVVAANARGCAADGIVGARWLPPEHPGLVERLGARPAPRTAPLARRSVTETFGPLMWSPPAPSRAALAEAVDPAEPLRRRAATRPLIEVFRRQRPGQSALAPSPTPLMPVPDSRSGERQGPHHTAAQGRGRTSATPDPDELGVPIRAGPPARCATSAHPGQNEHP